MLSFAFTLFSLSYARKVFIDVGGNSGDTLLKFFQGQLVGVSASEARQFDVYVFEPSKEFDLDYVKLARVYNFTRLRYAAHSISGRFRFGGSGLGGSLQLETGAGNAADMVDAIDFSKWLSSTIDEDDYTICKIDIEGSEYDVIPKMFRDGTLCLCDRLSVEWHAWIVSREDIGNGLISFNSPPGGVLHFPTSAKFRCAIPHLRRVLAFDKCYLPSVVRTVFALCNDDNNTKKNLEKLW